MKKTVIKIRVFQSIITIDLEGKRYLTLDGAKRYIKNNLEWETAQIIGLTHDGEEIDLVTGNPVEILKTA